MPWYLEESDSCQYSCGAMRYQQLTFMCRWLQQHQHALGPLADRTVQQLGLADHWVLKTPLDTSCIQVSLRCSALSVPVFLRDSSMSGTRQCIGASFS